MPLYKSHFKSVKNTLSKKQLLLQRLATVAPAATWTTRGSGASTTCSMVPTARNVSVPSYQLSVTITRESLEDTYIRIPHLKLWNIYIVPIIKHIPSVKCASVTDSVPSNLFWRISSRDVRTPHSKPWNTSSYHLIIYVSFSLLI